MPIEFSKEVLEGTPERVTRFLNGIGAEPTIRTLLFEAGMNDEEIVEGRTLLLACIASPKGAPAATVTEEVQMQRKATAELDEWDEPSFTRYGATLRRHHPEAWRYVFNDLAAATGASSVKGVATFLARVDALDKGTDKEREAMKDEDKKAVELLALRGLDSKERARLQELVHVALGPTAPLPNGFAEDELGEARRSSLVSLKSWYDEWAAAARAVIKKRAYLIRLGLASRRGRKAPGAEPPAIAPQ